MCVIAAVRQTGMKVFEVSVCSSLCVCVCVFIFVCV